MKQIKDKNLLYQNRLLLMRKNMGYKQKYVAKLLAHNNSGTLSDWENGKSMPNGTNLIKLCILYDTNLYKLYPDYYEYVNRTWKSNV